MSADDAEFTVRISGAAPPSSPGKGGGRKGGKGGRGGEGGGGQQRRYNLRLRPSSSLSTLRRDVLALFDVPPSSVDSYVVSFLGGFPPRALDQDGKDTVRELGVGPSESLIVRFAAADDAENGTTTATTKDDAKANAAAVAEGPPAKATAASSSSPAAAASTGSGRPRRAAAAAAAATFAEAIAAQDALAKGEKSPRKKRGAGGAPSSGAGKIAGFGNGGKRSRIVAGDDVASVLDKRPKKVSMRGAGYRLSDGRCVAGSSPSKRRRGGIVEDGFSSKDDVADKLLSSLGGGGGGGGGGKAGAFLRAAMRNAVGKSYEASRAACRVAAVARGDYAFERIEGGSVADGGVALGGAEADDDVLDRALFRVSYSKGIEGRGRYEERAEIVALSAVKTVLESVYEAKSSEDAGGGSGGGGGETKDARLRPDLIAQLSPRAFWSLVYHCSGPRAEGLPNCTAPSSVEDMLRAALPHLDWSHLERGGRKRALSEKARENLRQERETAAGSGPDDAVEDDEEAVKAIEQIEEMAMTTAADDSAGGLSERERRARAAMARFGNADDRGSSWASPPAAPKSDPADDWVLVTPAEDDVDELIECIMEGASVEGEEPYDEETAKAWAGILLGSVRNWRELANSDAQHVRSILAASSNSTTPSNGTIETWIDAAQERSVEEIMLLILDGDDAALEALVDKARSGSPRNLVDWQAYPGMLLKTISGEDESCKWQKSDVVRWIGRAKTALGACTWLEEYTTDAEPNHVTW